VEGWNAPNGGTLSTNGPIGNIVIASGQLSEPVATSNITTQINLDASQTVGSTGATFNTTIPVYDSLGATHDVSVAFTKTAANTWTYTATVPGADLTAGTAGTPSQIATGTLTFDSNGNLLTPAPPPPAANASIPFPITGLTDGAADLNVNFNLWNTSGATPVSNITQVDSQSQASAPVVDGSQAAQITGISIIDGGQIQAQYTGGTPRIVAQLAIAGIGNPESLASLGNSNYSVTAATSLPSIGVPDTGGRGAIMGGSLESSTVDIATQFTNLIVYQRSYEANAKVVTTADTLSQDTINIIPAS
jgi:flagellar hook protein FlgE